jgi:hypothetical protein
MLKVHKWLPETYLRVINFGPSPIEIQCSVKPDETKKGKKHLLKPHSEQFIMIKDLLPEQITDPSKLDLNNVLFNAKNVGNQPSNFNLFDEGPFKYDTTKQFPTEMHRIVDRYEEAYIEGDFYTMKQLVKTPVPEDYKQNKSFYTGICQLRGKMFGSLLRTEEADAEFEAGWKDYRDEDRWFYCFDWANALVSILVYPPASPALKAKMVQKAITVLEMGKPWFKGKKYEKHHLMGASCLKAFLLCYIGEPEEALRQFEEFDYRPLKPEEYLESELNNFFYNLSFGFWVAIELKHAELIRELSRIISTGFPDMMHEPSPIHCFRRATGNASQKGRRELDNAINNLIHSAHHYAPELPNLRKFAQFGAKHDDIEMDKFIPYWE